MSVVYFVQAGAGGAIKIGTAVDMPRRLSALQNGCPEFLVVLATVPGDREIEGRFHKRLRVHRIRGEWFKPAPAVLEAVEQARRGEIPSTDPAEPDPQFSWLGNLVALARAQVRQVGWSPTRLAVAAGLHRNTLLGIEQDSWNPSLSTLLAIEKFISLPFDEQRSRVGAA